MQRLLEEPDFQVSRQPNQFCLLIGPRLMTLIRTGSEWLGAAESFWNLTVPKNYLGILLKWRFWLAKSELGPVFWISNKIPQDAAGFLEQQNSENPHLLSFSPPHFLPPTPLFSTHFSSPPPSHICPSFPFLSFSAVVWTPLSGCRSLSRTPVSTLGLPWWESVFQCRDSG